MRFETENLNLKPLRLSPSSQGGSFSVESKTQSIALNSLQYSYLEVLQKTGSIERLVQFFLGQGWIVSFRELYKLLQILIKENAVTNPLLLQQEKEWKHSSVSSIESGHQFKNYEKYASADPSSLPFFRSLKPELARHLLQGAERHLVPAQRLITKTGDTNRDLFILLKGSASIYKVAGPGQRRLVSTLQPGAIFGERGFLLSQARTADIITTSDCEILRVRHSPEIDSLIKTDKAESLQYRFLALQALNSSEFFKDLPSYSLDSLIFSGKICKAHPHQVLMREGLPGNSCFILLQGNVVISKGGVNINVLTQGTSFGEISLLLSGGVRTATVMAQQECLLLEIQQQDFYRILAQNLILAKDIEELAAKRIQK